MRHQILKWFIHGETGVSSCAMAAALIGEEPKRKYHNHPSDPADFNRCLKLLTEVPEARKHMDRVSKLSPIWSKLVSRWDEVEKCFLNEAGYDWSKNCPAPKTYQLMKEIGC